MDINIFWFISFMLISLVMVCLQFLILIIFYNKMQLQQRQIAFIYNDYCNSKGISVISNKTWEEKGFTFMS
jgi:hypothetical protein